jgi:hypothetical protein
MLLVQGGDGGIVSLPGPPKKFAFDHLASMQRDRMHSFGLDAGGGSRVARRCLRRGGDPRMVKLIRAALSNRGEQ